MSETPLHNPYEHLPPPTEATQASLIENRLSGDRGAIDFSAVIERAGELVGKAVNSAKLAYHGIGMASAVKRMERAGDVMEQMDHKDALYTDYAAIYTSGMRSDAVGSRTVTETASSGDWNFPDGIDSPKTATPNGTEPRTRSERLKVRRMSHKLSEKRHKVKLVRDARKHHEKAVHVYETQDKSFYDDKRVPFMDVMKSNPVGRNSHNPRFKSKARQLEIDASYLAGNMSPEERRQRKNLAKVNRPLQETAGQIDHRKKEEEALKNLRREAQQPMLSRYRHLRRDGVTIGGERYGGAIKSIRKNNKRMEKHKRALESMGKVVPKYEP